MDNRKLEYFLAVMEHRNFARAAQAMGVSQPAITKNIARLEAELDVKLFERGLFGALPTEYAATLEIRARLIMAETRTATRELRALKEASKGELRIGVGPSIAPRIMPEIIARFHKRWPQVSVSCEVSSSSDLYSMVKKGDLDFAISSPPANFQIDSDLKVESLFEETDQVGMSADHPLAGNAILDAKLIHNQPWVVSRGVGLWRIICDYLRDAGYDPPVHVVHTSSADLAKGLMRRAGYLILLGNEHIYYELAGGVFVTRPLAGLKVKRTAYVCQRRRATPKPTVTNMVNFVRTFCANALRNSGGFKLPR